MRREALDDSLVQVRLVLNERVLLPERHGGPESETSGARGAEERGNLGVFRLLYVRFVQRLITSTNADKRDKSMDSFERYASGPGLAAHSRR
jgi:hypothetical protein